MAYSAPLSDYDVIFRHVVPLAPVAATETFAEASEDMAQAVLAEAARLCEDKLSQYQRNGDLHPAVLENGVVRTSPGFAEGHKAIGEGGWIGMSASPEHGGMGLPMTVTTAVNEMMSAACLSLQLNPLMTQGQIEALEHHASDAIKQTYLPKLISGAWAGTMNLSEPQAGSDVGALRTKAEPNNDGSYSITGQKIYISWGDNDFTENVCHLVLARLPDGVPGTKGISLFLVPKYLPKEDGTPGVANDLRVVSLEHKMGLHGSPTAVMEYAGAKGWLVELGPGGGSKIEAQFSGPDPAVLQSLAQQAKDVFAEDEAAILVKDDWREQVPVIHPLYSETRARRLGVSREDVAEAFDRIATQPGAEPLDAAWAQTRKFVEMAGRRRG